MTERKRCAKCSKEIVGRGLCVEGSYYHPDCFCCDKCKSPLSGKFHKQAGPWLTPLWLSKFVAGYIGFIWAYDYNVYTYKVPSSNPFNKYVWTISETLHPRKLAWTPNMPVVERKVLFKTIILGSMSVFWRVIMFHISVLWTGYSPKAVIRHSWLWTLGFPVSHRIHGTDGRFTY